jgi:hypothetical protein
VPRPRPRALAFHLASQSGRLTSRVRCATLWDSYGDVRVKDKWREMCDYMILLLIRSTNDNRGDIVGTRDVAHMGARAPWSRSGGPGGVGPQSHHHEQTVQHT